jgi:CubicO group peptidase (beta-lactamase class C family)
MPLRDYEGNVPGASVLVRRGGETIVRQSYGLADLENGIAVTPATNFRLASLTKQFTARAIEIAGVSLDAPITRWFPSLPPATAGDLVRHTSGLVDYEDLITGESQVHDRDVLHLLEHRQPYFAPGSQYRYSNGGYVLLGLIVEEVSGVPFETFLKREIFDPLGMHGTGFPPVANRAFGYAREGGAWVRRDQSVTSATRGDGGLYSSIDDLQRWTVPASFPWHRDGDVLWHEGETVSFRNVMVRLGDVEVTILTNRDGEVPYRLATAFADAL